LETWPRALVSPAVPRAFERPKRPVLLRPATRDPAM